MPSYNESLNGYTLNNDVDGGIPFKIDIMYDNKLYQVVDAETFMRLAKESRSKKAKQIASSITAESNPIIVIATLK